MLLGRAGTLHICSRWLSILFFQGLLVTELPLKPILLSTGAHRFSFSNCYENLNAEFPGTLSLKMHISRNFFFKEINSRIKMQQRTRKTFTLNFHRCWPFSDLAPPSLNPTCSWELHTSLSEKARGVGGCCVLLDGCSVWFLSPGGLWGCCSESWVHLWGPLASKT